MRKNLKYARENANMTLEKIARKVKISERTYCRYEAGTSIPRVDVACSIAKVLNSDVEELFLDDNYT